MRRLSIVLVLILVSALLLSVGAAHRVLARAPQRTSHQDLPPVPGGTPIVIGLPNLSPPTATVPSGSHPTKPSRPVAPPDAVRVALTNTYVKALLQGKPYRVRKVAPWPAGKGKLVVAAFYHSATVSGTWLAVGRAPYRATYRNVRSLNIYVRLTPSAVLAIVPH
jgi:hypothetical protein